MPQIRFGLAFELWNNSLSQYFAEFHTPLIKGVDLPDGSLGKDAVFVKRN